MAKGKRLLVVDDEESLRTLLEHELTSHGYAVETAEDGTSAMSKLDGKRFDLVVLDIRMPDMDGIEVLKSIREKNLADKVIMLTGVAELKFAQECLTLGANDFIAKPLDLETLHSCINRVFAS